MNNNNKKKKKNKNNENKNTRTPAPTNVPVAAPLAGIRTSLQISAVVAGRTRPSDLAGLEQRTSPAVAYTPALEASGVSPMSSLGDPYDVAVVVAAVVAAAAAAAAAADDRMVSAVEQHFVSVAVGRLESRRLGLPLPHYFLLDLLTVWRGWLPPLGVQYRSRSRTYPTLRVQKLCLIAAVSAACFLPHVSMRASSTR